MLSKYERDLIAMLVKERRQRKITQKEIASVMLIKQPALSRFENCHLNTLTYRMMNRYADAMGLIVKLELIPAKEGDWSE